MKEVERRVMEEEPVSLIGSPMCRPFGKLTELTRVTGRLNEVKHKDLLERGVRHLRFCFRMYKVKKTQDDCSCMSIRRQHGLGILALLQK